MFQERDGEKEILLGNKQLLGIFFVLAILFGVFFTAGYMVGHSGSKQSAETAEVKSPASNDAAATGGETHAVSPDPATTAAANPTDTAQVIKPSAAVVDTPAPAKVSKPAQSETAAALDADATREQLEKEPAAAKSTAGSDEEPAVHKTYLQVAALSHSEAETVAKVLSKKGFHAHVSPKAGTPFYRVLVGPVRNAGELNSTRAALKSKGFGEVFVQHL